MPRRSTGEHTEWDIWPVIADSFLGILAVIVLLFSDFTPQIDGKKEFLEQLRHRFTQDERSGQLMTFEIDANRVRLVYSAERLSFAQCNWSLDHEPAEMLRAHLRLFQNGAKLIRDITIDGHADRESAYNCTSLVPYRDNVQLSQNRARAVLNVLLGLDATQVVGLDELLWNHSEAARVPGLEYLYELANHGQIRVAGFGASIPLNPDNPRDPRNRRVELVIALR
jgi:flagellar motor protein MotB